MWAANALGWGESLLNLVGYLIGEMWEANALGIADLTSLVLFVDYLLKN